MKAQINKHRSNSQEDHSHKAYRGIRRLFYFKEIVPGQKISCRELSERFEMSLTPIIQALKLMEIQGFVERKPNRGYFVTPFSLKEVEEIYRLRERLEPSLIPETIQNLNEPGLKELKEALDAHLFSRHETFLTDRVFKNMEFHLTLARISKNETQVRVLRNVFDILLLKYGGNYQPVSFNETVNIEHQQIYSFVASRDSKSAKSELSAHIARTKSQTLESFRKILEEKELPVF